MLIVRGGGAVEMRTGVGWGEKVFPKTIWQECQRNHLVFCLNVVIRGDYNSRIESRGNGKKKN